MKKIFLIVYFLSAFATYSQVDGYFDCNTPLNLSCNKIANPEFIETDPFMGMHDFYNNNIPFWYDSHGSSDANWNSGPPFGSVNPVAMHVGTFYEGIVSKISPVIVGRKYAFSFFIHANPYTANNVRINVALTQCGNFSHPGYSFVVPALSSPNQKIYCENLPVGTNGFAWKQVFVEFTAQANFDMIRIYPDQTVPNVYPGAGYIDIAYPELIDITSFAAGFMSWDEDDECMLNIAGPPCTVKNARFTWRDPNNNIIQQGGLSSLALNMNVQPLGNYTLTMTVPGAVVTNNTCSNNTPAISATVNVAGNCNCSNSVQIEDAEISYIKTTSNNVWNWVTEPLNECETNILCFSPEELIQFSASSASVNNNLWEARVVPGFGNIDANFYVAFNSIPNPNPLLGNYMAVGSSQSLNLDISNAGSAGYTFMIEIRLTNTVTGVSKNLFVKVIYPSGTGQGNFFCIPTSPNANYPHQIIYGNNLPGYTYSWSLPAGMTPITSLTNCQIEFHDNLFNYSLNPNPVATLTVSNSFGCNDYVIDINIGENDCTQGRALLKNNKIEKIDKEKVGQLQISPNPISKRFRIDSDKEIMQGVIFNAQGVVVKQLNKSEIQSEISIMDFKPGIYFIKVFYKNNMSEVKSIIKQ